jgi:Protein of unknown function (DUF2867)
MSYITSLEAAQPFLVGANHFDEKVIEGEVNLREFLAGFLSYYPSWIQALYAVRAGFVRLLGMRQHGMPKLPNLRPEDVSFQPGVQETIFQVRAASEDAYWIAAASDTHLTASLIVVAEPLNGSQRRFHIGTVVHYHNWAGPIYFNVIRPFHHVVVKAMAQAGVRRS